jgi:two-component system cell cycle response regulator
MCIIYVKLISLLYILIRIGGSKMNKLYEKVKERLSLIDNMYDIIRIIDPINKNIINISNNEITIHKEKCYDLLSRGRICTNCISMRAYIEKDTVIKMEYITNKVMLIVATPVNVGEETYVVEIIKDISSQNNMASNINCNFNNNVKTIIDSINKKIITDESTGTYNKIYVEGRLPVELNNSVENGNLLSLIMIKIDKQENLEYKYGQDIDKKILNDFIKSINDSVNHNSYWIGRYSDNKFLLVLNDVNQETSYKILEQIKKLSEDVLFNHNYKIIKLKVTFSIYCSENEIIDIKDILIELEKSLLEEKQERINKENKLPILNYRIQELRNILNEMNISSAVNESYKETLKISQELDELIVEYMKNIISK